MILFYDTCSLINHQRQIFDEQEKFYISSITINELEKIKSSFNKDEDTKYKVRILLNLLKKHEDKYEIVVFKNKYLRAIKKFDLPDCPDTRILATAYTLFKNQSDYCFVTDDLACFANAKILGLNTSYTWKDNTGEKYTGYIDKLCSDELLDDFYSLYLQENFNYFNLLDNQYLILRDKDGKIIDKYKWHDNKYIKVQYHKIESNMFGKISPKENDIYQTFAIDSLMSNQITVMRGKAGTGKSLLGLAYLFQELERGRIDKIIMFVNPVATKDSCKFGFLPGTANEKILGSQIGHFLVSKIGDITAVEKLVYDGKIELIPIADCRGYDTTGMSAGIYITEGQNTTKEIMKLILQRIGEDSICVIEGDDETQVDMVTYGGNNNGLRRMSEVFRGADFYGEVTLVNCYRSKIAALAENF